MKPKKVKGVVPISKEPNNSSRDPAQPDEDELYIDSASLSEESLDDPFLSELFPSDGRGSTEEPPKKPYRQVVESPDEPGGVSEYSLSQSTTRK